MTAVGQSAASVLIRQGPAPRGADPAGSNSLTALSSRSTLRRLRPQSKTAVAARLRLWTVRTVPGDPGVTQT
jgi:hypothetical protein